MPSRCSSECLPFEALAANFHKMSDGARRYFAKEFGIGRAAAKAAKGKKSKRK